MRITQQFTLYEAEHEVPCTLRGAAFLSQEEIQTWVTEEVIGSDWWPGRFPQVIGIECPTVKRRRNEGSVAWWYQDTGMGVIEMAKVHWSPMYVLHEVAHVAAGQFGSKSHDPIFARVYLELVYRVLGVECWTELRSSFLRHLVCFDERCLTTIDCKCGSRTDVREGEILEH